MTADPIERCGIKHAFGDQVCCREKGHDGYCRCKSERGVGGTLTYSEWVSRDSKFHRHVGYRTIYPANAER
jgi:hypothetical protein